MTSALHAEGREFNPPLEYTFCLAKVSYTKTESTQHVQGKRQWCIGNIEASQALAPGSTPGWRTSLFFFFFFFFLFLVWVGGCVGVWVCGCVGVCVEVEGVWVCGCVCGGGGCVGVWVCQAVHF